jgi:hypothetical protein
MELVALGLYAPKLGLGMNNFIKEIDRFLLPAPKMYQLKRRLRSVMQTGTLVSTL